MWSRRATAKNRCTIATSWRSPSLPSFVCVCVCVSVDGPWFRAAGCRYMRIMCPYVRSCGVVLQISSGHEMFKMLSTVLGVSDNNFGTRNLFVWLCFPAESHTKWFVVRLDVADSVRIIDRYLKHISRILLFISSHRTRCMYLVQLHRWQAYNNALDFFTWASTKFNAEIVHWVRAQSIGNEKFWTENATRIISCSHIRSKGPRRP